MMGVLPRATRPPDDSQAIEPSTSPRTLIRCFEQVASIRYQRDQETDYWQSPRETAQLGRGDCEDKALYLQALLREQGIETELVFGVEDRSSSQRMHAWLETDINGQRYILDPSNGFVGRRDNMAAARHMPVIGLPNVKQKLIEYKARTGATNISLQNELLIAIEADQLSRSQESSANAMAVNTTQP